MSYFIRHIAIFIFAVFGLVSCTRDHDTSNGILPDEEQWEGGAVGDKTLLVLHISPLDARATDQKPVEKVKTLRVIIINKGDTNHEAAIECNRFIELPTTLSSQVSYTLTWPTYSGAKKVYVIANEASVEEGFTNTLNGFEESSNPANFQNEMDNYAFNPNYRIEDDSSIYLPYTFYYDNLTATQGEVKQITAYLVPVATKFMFKFTNKRNNPVDVNEISLKYVDTSNYLFAQVGSTDSYKDFEGSQYYWTDWLAKVAEASHEISGSSQNESFNNLYGWITDYDIPSESISGTYTFVDKAEKNNPFVVPGATIDETDEATSIPGTYTVGPIYVSESKNFKNASDGQPLTGQTYYLTMDVEDSESKTAPEFANVAISNLKALFRNTFVIININMSQDDVKVYAEIADWNHKSANGWVIEGKEPNPNPYQPSTEKN